MKLYVGLDPGITGGLALLKVQGRSVTVRTLPMPIVPHFSGKGNEVDPAAILWFISGKKGKPKTLEELFVIPDALAGVVIERAANMPIGGKPQGGTSLFNYGDTFGLTRAFFSVIDVPLDFPHPATWQAKLFPGMKKNKEDPKARALQFVQANYPQADLHLSPKAKNADLGVVDAICLAHYAMLLGEE